MTYDALTRVSNNQVLAGAPGGLALSEKSINLLSSGITARILGRDVGPGTNLAFRLHITQAFDAGAGNLSVSVAFTTDEALLSGTFVAALTIPNAALTLGKEFDVPIPKPTLALIGAAPQYLGLLYVASGGAIATGALSAWMPLGHSAGLPRVYNANYTSPK